MKSKLRNRMSVKRANQAVELFANGKFLDNVMGSNHKEKYIDWSSDSDPEQD